MKYLIKKSPLKRVKADGSVYKKITSSDRYYNYRYRWSLQSFRSVDFFKRW